jgi:hypothetical protein
LKVDRFLEGHVSIFKVKGKAKWETILKKEQRRAGTFYLQQLALTLPTGGGHSIGVVRSRTKTMESF